MVACQGDGVWLWRDGRSWFVGRDALGGIWGSPAATPGCFIAKEDGAWRALARGGSATPMADGPERRRLAARGGALARGLADRAAVVAGLRSWLDRRGFLEVHPPSVVTCPGLELHLDAVQARLTSIGASPATDARPVERWLATSPELHHKRLLVGGITQPYSVGPVWRAGERGARHNPEFTMLEWYRAGGTLDDVINDTVALVRQAARTIRRRRRKAAGADSAGPPATSPVRRHAFLSLLQAHAGLDVGDATDDAQIVAQARRAGLAPAPSERPGDILLRAFGERVEPAIAEGGVTIVERWPARLASLARRLPDAPHLAARFELYWGGVELANGFDELTCPSEQRARCEADLAARAELGLPAYPLDERFLAALEEGCPPSAGVALGVDRLVMVAGGYRAVDDVLAFPFELA